MQEENRSNRRKTCGSKFELETKWTYSALQRRDRESNPGSMVRIAEKKYRYATCFLNKLIDINSTSRLADMEPVICNWQRMVVEGGTFFELNIHEMVGRIEIG